MNERRENNAKSVWQEQAREARAMSLDEVHRRAKELEDRTRRKILSLYVISAIVAFGFVIGFVRADDMTRRAGCALLALWAVWFAIEGYRRISPKTMPEGAGAKDCVEFYRGELIRRRDYSARILQLILPVIAGMALIVWPDLFKPAPKFAWINAVPICVLVIAWIIFYFPAAMRERSKIQVELDELNALRRANTL